MYLGEIVESGPAEAVFGQPRHPYTAGLIAAAPRLRPGRRAAAEAVMGELPSPIDIPQGCSFAGRCPKAQKICRETAPALRLLDEIHAARCHFAEAI
jgi:oligopeptide transport system ATP-binding protein